MKQQNTSSSGNAFRNSLDASTRPGRCRRRPFLAAAAIIATAPALMASAEELVKAYVVYDLGTLGGDSSRAAGINDLGEIVGTAQNSSGVHRAFIYYSSTMYDLNSKLTFGPGHPALECAYDINESSQIVGGVNIYSGGFDERGPYHSFDITGAEAFALDPDGSSWDYYDLGVLTDGDDDGDGGVAFALNDDDEPVVVGTFNTKITDSCSGAPFSDIVNRGAYVDFFDDVPTSLGPINNDTEDDEMSYAMDVNDTVDDAQRIGGWSGECPFAGLGLIDNDANLWGSVTEALLEADEVFETHGHHVRGVDAGDDASVGFGVKKIGSELRWLPLYWPEADDITLPTDLISGSSDDTPYDLFEDAEEGLANAISNNDLQQVVGAVWEFAQFDTKYATVWTKCSGGWYATDLTAASEATSNGWVRLCEATDINDDGRIVGYGLKDLEDDEYHAFLLVPFSRVVAPYDPCP